MHDGVGSRMPDRIDQRLPVSDVERAFAMLESLLRRHAPQRDHVVAGELQEAAQVRPDEPVGSNDENSHLRPPDDSAPETPPRSLDHSPPRAIRSL